LKKIYLHMRCKMHKNLFVVILLIGFVLGGSGFAQTPNNSELFEKAKLMLFDRQWDQALSVLDEYLKLFPNSVRYPLALFYKGKCLEEKKMYKKALESYNLFLEISLNESLTEEATVAIIDVYFELYQQGEKKYLEKISGYLNSRKRAIQYYAAFKLSYAADKQWARKAVPVLKNLLLEKKDDELKDRAKIALMRIDPAYLKELSESKSPEASLLHIQVFDKNLKKVSFNLSIPLFLGQLALESIPQKEKTSLKRKGYDIDVLLKKLALSGDLLKIDDEGATIKIWID
jgi:tetratricopeptide (TPR) repeat protein